MKTHPARIRSIVFGLIAAVLCTPVAIPVQSAEPITGVPLEKARICITGYDHNRPDPFPGLGDFIGWVGDLVRLKNGDLLFSHSAGYWHVSFATPVVLNANLVESYKKAGLDLNFPAPTGGRIMACRSSDQGKTWSKPELVYDGKLDAGPSATCVTSKGTVIQIINVQASWYGFPKAPTGHQKLNTQQLYIRSTDHGRTWSKPRQLKSSGTYYTRGRSRILQLPDGGLLWMCYDMNEGGSLLDGTIHRSDDDGKTWRIVSIIRRRKPTGDRFNAKNLVVSGDVDRFLQLGSPRDDQWINTDEGDLGRLSSGRLVLIVRPDGGTLVSDDQASTWKQIGRVGPTRVFAPHMVVLRDDTLVLTAGGSGGQCVFLSTDGGRSWSNPIRIAPSCYGYGKLTLLEDQTVFLSYVQKHAAPQRCMLVRFRVNKSRNGVELLSVGD